MSLGMYDNQKLTHIKHWSTKAVRDPRGMIKKPAFTEMWVFTPGWRPSYCMFSLLINQDINPDAMSIGISVSQIPSICKILVTMLPSSYRGIESAFNRLHMIFSKIPRGY